MPRLASICQPRLQWNQCPCVPVHVPPDSAGGRNRLCLRETRAPFRQEFQHQSPEFGSTPLGSLGPRTSASRAAGVRDRPAAFCLQDLSTGTDHLSSGEREKSRLADLFGRNAPAPMTLHPPPRSSSTKLQTA